MIKFAIMTPSMAQPGGAERTILIKVRYSDPTRMQCTGVAISGHGLLDEALGKELLKYTKLHGDAPAGRLQKFDRSLVDTNYQSLNEAVKCICRHADVLVAWGSLSLSAQTVGLSIPVVCVSHCSNSAGSRFAGITHLVAVSRAACNYFSQATEARDMPIKIIPNGVEVDRVCPRRGRDWQRADWGVSASDKVLLYLGRHAGDKNLESCIMTLTRLPSEYKLIMVGNQAYFPNQPLPSLVALTEKLGLEDRVKFLPPTQTVGDALAGADCLMHLSFREADSLVVKEAFLAGVPLVHTHVGSIPEMETEFGQVGWSVAFHSGEVDPGEAALQVRTATSAKARIVADKMREIAWAHWTAPAMCDRWANYLEEICAGWSYLPGWGPESRPVESIMDAGSILTRNDRMTGPIPHGSATDYSKVRTLPREIVFPTAQTFKGYYIPWVVEALVGYVVRLARGLEHDVWRLDGQKPMGPHSARGFPPILVDTSTRTVVRESADLKPIDLSSFPILVDGTEVVIDFGDWNIVRAGAADHAHWLRFHFHSSYKSYPWIGSFPPATFMDWTHYDRTQRRVREHRDPHKVGTILHNLFVHESRDSRRRRRFMVHGMLDYEFGERMDFAHTSAEVWHAKAEHALCYVQVPGSWENILDRGQLQMIGLGIPTISPIMIDQCCDGLLQPGIHYLACRQDYLDVPDLVRWCQRNRDEAAAMGHNAWLFFQEFCTPIAVWSYVKDRIENGARHWRDSLDDDLSPPGLYDPQLLEVKGMA